VDLATGKQLIFTYMHMQDVPKDKDGTKLKENDPITKGQYIGKSGNTGHSDGPHLHLEVSNSGERWGTQLRLLNRVNPAFVGLSIAKKKKV